jgi:hypothetical protein
MPFARAARLLAGGALAASLLALQGCLPGLLVVQAVPGVMGSVAMANADNRDPFVTRAPYAPPRTDAELAAIDAHLLAAHCGDARSQYWLASALGNEFNTSPDRIEIYKWLRLAEGGGIAAATPQRERLDASLTPLQIAEADRRVRQWRPRAEGCPASG